MGDKKIKVLVAIPRGASTYTAAIDNQLDMAFYLGQLESRSNFKFYMATIGRLFVAKAREEFAKWAVDNDMDYILMIDDDMICPVDLFEKLYAHDVDIVAPLAFQRRAPYLPVIYKTREGYDTVRQEKWFSNEIVKNYPKDTLFECDAVGFGAVLIKKWVLEKYEPPRFMSTCPTGEDILFCYNARERIGAKVYVDTSTKIDHLSDPVPVGEADYEKACEMDTVREIHGDYKDEIHGVSP